MATTSVTFTADSAVLALFVEAACASYGYSPTVPDPASPGKTLPNPQTPEQFAQQQIIRYCGEVTKAYQVNKAAESARQAALAAAQAAIDGAAITITTK